MSPTHEEKIEAVVEGIFKAIGNQTAEKEVLQYLALFELARAINRLAATQEKPKTKGAVSYSVAHFEDQPDVQTQELRDLQRQRGEGGEE